MTQQLQNPDKKPVDDFERLADEKNPGIIAEFIDFLKHNKRWWLTPIILVLLLVGVLVIASSSAVAPFLYTLW